jgi:hypothetical protein
MKKLFIIIAVLLLPCWVGATTYYVIDLPATGCADNNPASATVDGTDYNPTDEDCDGGGSDSYYSTIADINAAAATLEPGDTISFNKGGIWRESLIMPEDGSSGNLYTFTSHGTGDAPVISGGDDMTGSGYDWIASGAGSNEYFMVEAGSGTGTILIAERFDNALDFGWDDAVGGDSYEADTGAGGTSTHAREFTDINGADDYSETHAADKNSIYVQVFFKLSVPAVWTDANYLMFYKCKDNADALVFRLQISYEDPNYVFKMAYYDNATIIGSSVTISLDTWYEVQAKYDTAGGTDWAIGKIREAGASSWSTSVDDDSQTASRTPRKEFLGVESEGVAPTTSDLRIDRFTSATGGWPPLDPAITETYIVAMDDTLLVPGTVGSLADHEWTWDTNFTNDNLQFNTVFVADATGDPDGSGAAIEAAQRDYVIDWNKKSYITVQNLQLEFSNGDTGEGVIKNVIGVGLTSTVNVIDNCEIYFFRRKGVHWQGPVGLDLDLTISNTTVAHGAGGGIGIQGNDSSKIVSNFTGDTNIIHNILPTNTRSGTWGYGYELFWATNFTVKNSKVYDIRHVGIKLDGDGTDGVDDSFVLDNWVYNCGASCIVVEKDSDDNLIARNLIYNYSVTSVANMGISIDTGSQNNDIIDNVVYDGADQGWGAIVVRGSDAAGPSSGTLIYNNSIWEDSNQGIIIQDGGTENTAVGTKIKNNIVQSNTYALNVSSGDYTNFESNYNILESDGGADCVIYETTPRTLVEWQGEALGEDANSIDADPLYTTAGSDFTLQYGSPAYDAGINLGASYDDCLHPSSSWPSSVTTVDQDLYPRWEIGAYCILKQKGPGVGLMQ